MHALYDRAAALARTYAFQYVETPVFEATELFARTSGETSDVVSKEMYSFQDRGDRMLTLRPEGTAPVMRAYLHRWQHYGGPFKVYYLTRMYRYSRPQAGRFREHRQFGIEIFGVEAATADVEVIEIGDAFLRSLGLRRYRLELNSIGDEVCRPAYREVLLEYLRGRKDELRDEHRDRFEENPLRVLDCKDDACRKVAAGAPAMVDHLCDACAAHFDGVQAGVRAAGLRPTIVPTLVRGLDYYTRTAFEFLSGSLSQAQATVCGGGRYDGLAEVLGGPPTPGVGFAIGLDRVLLALREEGATLPGELGVACFVVSIGPDASQVGTRLVQDLRDAGIPAAAAFEDRPLKAQLKMADRSGAAYAVIVGEKEVAASTAILKRLSDGVQEEVPIGDVVNWLSRTDWAAER
jgi:histidyl-tRNA synthetase